MRWSKPSHSLNLSWSCGWLWPTEGGRRMSGQSEPPPPEVSPLEPCSADMWVSLSYPMTDERPWGTEGSHFSWGHPRPAGSPADLAMDCRWLSQPRRDQKKASAQPCPNCQSKNHRLSKWPLFRRPGTWDMRQHQGTHTLWGSLWTACLLTIDHQSMPPSYVQH